MRGGGAAYLPYRTDPECRAPLRSSQLRRSYQTPGRDTSSVTSAGAAAASSPTCPQTHRGDVFGGELVRGVRDEQAGFTHSTVTHDNTLDGLHGCASLFPAHPRSAAERESDKKAQSQRKWNLHGGVNARWCRRYIHLTAKLKGRDHVEAVGRPKSRASAS